MNFFQHPFWSVGFRPLFALAMLSGLSLPLLWVFGYSGHLTLPARFSAVQWHAHEMFFGFGWAVLGGFLLTSTKNWVNIRGYHGAALAGLATAWLLERLAMGFADCLPGWLFVVLSNLYLAAIVLMLLTTLVSHRESDSYRVDNRFFLIVLPLFILAKNLLLNPDTFTLGGAWRAGCCGLRFWSCGSGPGPS